MVLGNFVNNALKTREMMSMFIGFSAFTGKLKESEFESRL